jgi:hypothetical protein
MTRATEDILGSGRITTRMKLLSSQSSRHSNRFQVGEPKISLAKSTGRWGLTYVGDISPLHRPGNQFVETAAGNCK